MFRRGGRWLAANGAGAVVCCLALLACSSGVTGAGATGHAAPGPADAGGLVPANRDTLAACARRLAAAPGGRPVMAIAGASYTAGVGPRDPALSWAVQLARMLRWNAVIYGVPGAGYVRAGAGGRGPVPEAPLLAITRTTTDGNGDPIEFSRDLFRGDRTRVVVRSGGGAAGSSTGRAQVVELHPSVVPA